MFFKHIRVGNVLHGAGVSKQGRGGLLRVPLGALNVLCSKSKGHSIKYVNYIRHYDPDHDHKNMTLKRPMSPHLMHYAPTLPAMTSIGQRITGTMVTVYALGLAWGALFLPNGVLTYVSIIQSLHLSGFTIFILKFLIGAPFSFHYFNGMRYIAFNFAKYMDKKSVYDTSYKCVMAAGIMNVFFAII